jgi:hypothetical protein
VARITPDSLSAADADVFHLKKSVGWRPGECAIIKANHEPLGAHPRPLPNVISSTFTSSFGLLN